MTGNVSDSFQVHFGVSTGAVVIEKAKSTSRVQWRTFATARLIDSSGDFGSFYAVSVSK